MMKRFTPSFGFPLPARTHSTAIVIGLFSSGCVFGVARPGLSLPQSPAVQSGQVQIQQRGKRLDVIQSTPKASINWNQFSIDTQEGVFFRQPTRQSVILNRVTGDIRSDIAGTLEANGTVLLLNPNGILFSPTSKVDVGGILATTLELQEQDFLAGTYRFQHAQQTPFATVENFGTISVKEGGFAALVAPGVKNRGIIQAKFGQVVLGSGTAFTLDFYQDGLLSFEIDPQQQGPILGSDGQPITSLIDHSGQIQAAGGSVFLTVQSGADVLGNLINLDGLTQAQTVANRDGKIVLSGRSAQPTVVSGVLDVSGLDGAEIAGTIELDGSQLIFESASLNAEGGNGGGKIHVLASDSVMVDAGSQFGADATQGDAGEISILSAGATQVAGDLSAAARGEIGKGGQIETSGKQLAIAPSTSIDVSATSGQSGTWTVDPDQLFVAEMGETALPGPATGDYTVASSAVEAALALGNVELQANNLIQINDPIDTSTSLESHELSLEDQNADGDLTVNLFAPITLGPLQTLRGDATEVNVGSALDGIAQNAVDVAAPNAIVNLPAGTFKRNTTVFSPSVINVNKNVTIRGQGPDQTLLDGANGLTTRVVTVENLDAAPVADVAVTLENLAIVNGEDIEGGNGGGLEAGINTDVTLNHVRVENNRAGLGGGIFTQGKLSVIESVITGNLAEGDPFAYGYTGYYTTLRGTGAGIFGDLTSDIRLSLTEVSENEAFFAAGGVASFGTSTIDQSTIAGNTAQFGAGMVNLGNQTLINSTLSENLASDSAGGIANGPETLPGYYFSDISSTSGPLGQLKILNTTISGNGAEETGGGLVNYAGNVTIINSTITGNQAGAVAGGIGNYPADLTYGDRMISIANSIISGNDAPSSPEAYEATGYATIDSQGFNLFGQNNMAGGFPSAPNDRPLLGSIDTVLAPLSDNGGPTQTHALIADSPAIDAGSNDLAVDDEGNAITIDQRGGERSPSGLNAGDTVDIGAFEATSSYVVTKPSDENTIGNLRAAVGFVNVSENFNPLNLASPVPNTIRFDAELFEGADPMGPPTPAIIGLQQGELSLANPETPILIDGPNLNPSGAGFPGASILTISGETQSRILNISSGTTATIQGVTLSNGQASVGGAVQVLPGANVTVVQSQIRNNNATAFGGGVSNLGQLSVTNTFIGDNQADYAGGGLRNLGVAVIQTSVIQGNLSGSGGGVANQNEVSDDGTFVGDLTIDNSIVLENRSNGEGGGISNQGLARIQNSFVLDNTAADDGGGIINDDNDLTLVRSQISRNRAGTDGGGLHNDVGTVTIRGSEFSDNRAAGRGGGIFSDASSAEPGAISTLITNSTISGNTAGSDGGGLAVEDGVTTATHVTLALNQVTGTDGSGGGIIVDDGADLSLNSSIVSGNSANLNSEINIASPDSTLFSNSNNFVGQNGDRGGFPESETVFETAFEQNLAPLSGYGAQTQSHALLPGSEAIDAVPNLLETDQRGIDRPQGEASDAGAFESQGFSLVFEGGSPQSTVVNTDFPETLLFQVFANDSLEPVEGGQITVDAPFEGASLAEPFLALEVDAEGLAETTITANTIAGTYEAIAGFGNEFVSVDLENLPDVPAFISPLSGTPQETVIGTPFDPLQAKVTDQFGNELSDVFVSFEAPAAGPSALFDTASSTPTDEAGIAAVELTANNSISSLISGDEGEFLDRYVVFARSGELAPAQFLLANLDASNPPTESPTEPPVVPPVSPTPPIVEPRDPVEPTEPVVPGESLTGSTAGSPVEKVDEELRQTLDPSDPPTPPTLPDTIPTPSIALTPTLEEQLVRLETIFSEQYQQFLGTGSATVLRPQDVREQLKRAKESGDFNPAVIYTFFAPQGSVSEKASAGRATDWLASADQNLHLAQAEISNESCLANQQAKANDPLWQFDTCGWQNFAPSIRPPKESDQLVLLLVTSEGQAIRQVVPDANRTKVLATVKAFQRSVTDLSVPTSQSQAMGQQVYNWIVNPLQDELDAEEIDNLVFIMDEGLRSMPLAAMHDGTGYLIENYSVGLMPSMSLADTDFVSVKEMQVLAMGADEFQNQSPLPSVPLEISTIAQDIWQGESFLNERFTPETLTEARQNAGFGIVHLATHGEFRAGDRDRSYIQFWDQKVRIDELDELGLTASPPVSLLVLSACRTALGDPSAELGFTGLAVSSGVQTAMGGLWYVSDVGTLGLMSSFYKNLRSAPIKAEALRLAQLSMMNGTTRIENAQVITPDLTIPLPSDLQPLSRLDLSHPYYWSGITMIGTPW